MSDITLDDSALIGLLARADVLKAFPGFASLKPMTVARGACGRCSRKAAQQKQQQKTDMSSLAQRIKLSIMGLPTDKKAELKRVLGATRVTVYFAAPGKSPQPYVF